MTENEQPNAQEYAEELKKIREEHAKARRLFNSINEYYAKFDEIKRKLADDDDGLEANFEWVKNKKEEVDATKASAQSALSEIATNLQKVKENIQAMQAAYNEFSEIKGKVSGRGEEIEGLLASAKKLKEDIERTKTDAQQTLESIKKSFNDIQTKIQEMQKVYEDFLQIKGKIEDENTGLEAIHNSFQDLQKKSKAIFDEIKSFRDESNKLLEKIKKDKEEASTMKTDIIKNLKSSEENRDLISKLTDLITDTGFANSFQQRAKKLFWSYFFWGAVFILSVLVLSYLLIHFLGSMNGDIPETKIIIYRLTLTSPLLFLIGFSMTQYKKERDLHEKYSFKATTATTIRNHVEFLTVVFESKTEILEFIKATFTTIYKEPYETHDVTEKRIEELLKKRTDSAEPIDIKGITNAIKELKKLIPNESLLEKVIGIFIKN